MRLPAQEHDGFLLLARALRLDQHARLAGLHQLERLQAELVVLDHPRDQGVAVVAGFDPVDLAPQFLLEPGDVGEGLEAFVVQVGRHGQRVLGAHQVGCLQHLDVARLHEGLDDRRHGRVPVAQEHVDLLFLHAREDDGHGRDGDPGLVAQAFEHHRGQPRGGRDVAPAHVRKVDGLAPGVFGEGLLPRQQAHRGEYSCYLHLHVCSSWKRRRRRPDGR